MLTVRDIQRGLIVQRYRRSFIIPNYTPRDWWECDLFEITKAGFFREYEIKMSRSDFKADAKKKSRNWQWDEASNRGVITEANKHDELKASSKSGPKQFYFVTPAGLVAPSELPTWAGLIEIHERTGHRVPFNVTENVVVKAPQLHRHALDPKVKAHAESICYWRFHNVFLRGKIEATQDE